MPVIAWPYIIEGKSNDTDFAEALEEFNWCATCENPE